MIHNDVNQNTLNHSLSTEISPQEGDASLDLKPANQQQLEADQNRFDRILNKEGVGFSLRDGAEQLNSKNVADNLNSLMAGGLQRANKRAAELEEEDKIDAFELENKEFNNLLITIEESQYSDNIFGFLYDANDTAHDEQFWSREWK